MGSETQFDNLKCQERRSSSLLGRERNLAWLKARETPSHLRRYNDGFQVTETFLKRFIFPTLMRSKVKLLEMLLKPLHAHFWLSKT